MLDWLRRLRLKKRTSKEKPMEIVRVGGVTIKTDIPEIAEKARRHATIMRELEKHECTLSIRAKNLERRQKVLGSGLKSHNFRPRPAHEKKLWKLDKKAEDD